MSEKRQIILPTEPSPGSIRVCEGCVLSEGDGEAYISPYNSFVMDLSQAALPKEDRVGRLVTRVSLLTRHDIQMPETSTYEAVDQPGALLPTPCPDLKETELASGVWDTIKELGCPGPEAGRKRYLLLGEREVSCGLLRTLRTEAL